MLASVLLSKHLGVHAGVAMGQKRDETVKHDRLRTIMQTIVEQSGGKLRPVLRLVFDSSPAILAVSPFAMERQLYSLATHGATS